jgi:hypothetical protein
MEDIEEALTFRDRFHALFVTDDNRRWKIIAFIITTGTAFSALDIFLLGGSLDEVVTGVTAWALLCYVGVIAWHCSFKYLPTKVESVVPARRLFLQGAIAVIVLIVMWRIPRSEAKTLEQKLKDAAETPSDTDSVQRAKEAIDKARAGGIEIAQSTLEDVGRKFANASQSNPKALAVALACADYKSFLTPLPVPVGRFTPTTSTRTYRFKPVQGKQLPLISESDPVLQKDAAQIRPIINDNLNEGIFGARLVMLTGGGIYLDGLYVKNAIIRDSYVVYEAGGVELVNVYFVNCKFDMWNDVDAVRLVNIILSSRPPLTFSLPESTRHIPVQ